MKEKSSYGLCLALLGIWQCLCWSGVIPAFLLPSPLGVIEAMKQESSLLLHHSKYTLWEAFCGLTVSVVLALILACCMHWSPKFRASVYPLLILSQTIPSIAIAPLLVLWFGYGILPKVLLIVSVCFFPLTIALWKGFDSPDPDALSLMKTMGATPLQIFYHVTFPWALPQLFSGLRIAVSYSIIGAVIAEWLGGLDGLGVYMIRVKKSYRFDQMFAAIAVVSCLSLLLTTSVSLLESKVMPWKHHSTKKTKNQL